MKLLVADAGPLIIMASSDHLALLSEVAGQVLVPQTVYAECVTALEALQVVLETRLIQLVEDAPISGSLADAPLDPGEKAALATAAEMSCPVLVDERKARKIAQRHGLTVIGSAGILLRGKQLGVIKRVQPILEEWKSCGYFLSDELIAQVLRLAGED